MLSGNLHWLTVGLALLVSAGRVHGQTGIPLKPAGMAQTNKTSVQPASYMQGAAPGYEMMAPGMPMWSPGGEMPMHMAMPGPPPMDVAMEQGAYCNSGVGCDSMGGGLFGRGLTGCGYCGGRGCGFCGAGNGCLGSGALLGILAPYSEGGRGAQRWFDISVGTIALSRDSSTGPFQSAVQDIQTGVFLPTTVLSTNGVNGPVVLRSTDVDASKTRFGLEVVANLQTGPGAQIEARYFGLNKWKDSQTARLATPDLFSVFSLFGTDPVNGFDDTDRSFIHSVSLDSSLNSGEVSYKRFFGMPATWLQGGWQAGVRYLDIDERFGFRAVGSNNNAFQFNQLRFFNMDTRTRNQLTGFQVGGELWANLVPGLMLGAQSKSGVYGNHSEVESTVVANSIAGARDFLQDGKTAYVSEFIGSVVYRLNYSWSFRGSYNLLYVDNVALAQENFNPRDLSNAIGQGNYTANRVTYLNNDGEAFYHGFTLAGEWAY
jgi:hypothetical protein